MTQDTRIILYNFFYVHVTVHRNKFPFNKTNRRTNFPNLFLSRNATCFGQFLYPPSGVFYCIIGIGICHAGFDESFQARPRWNWSSSAHYQEFSTVYSALVCVMQVSDSFQARPRWNCNSILVVLESCRQDLHDIHQCRVYSRKLLMMGRETLRNM